MLFNLFVLSFLLPFVLSFQITVPATVKVNSPATAEWIRTGGDASSFGFLLRRNNQDKGGELITVVSSSDAAGQITFTAKEETQYLIEIISDTSPLGPNDQPKKIFATSNGFSAVRDSDPPAPTSTTTTPPPTTTTRTSTSTSTTSAATNTPPSSPPNTVQNTTPNTSTGATTATSAGRSNGNNSGNDQGGTNQGQSSSSTNPTLGGNASSITQATASPTPPSFLPPLTTSSDDTTASSTNTATVSVITVSGSLEPNPTPTLAGGASGSSKTGIIIGAVFGALIGILLIFSLLFSYNRYQRRKRTKAFQRDLMVRRPGVTPFNFAPTMTEEKDVTNADLPFERASEERSITESSYSQVTAPAPQSHHSYAPSMQSAVSSSPSVFYTAVPKPAQPQLAPGFTFPAVRPPSTSVKPEAPKTDRQIAIQNKMAQLRTRLILLQSQNARGSGYSSDSVSMDNSNGNGDWRAEEIQRIREELARLGEIMNSDWALRQTNDIPAGLV